MSNENYIVINGKKAELTEEQLKALGIEKKSNPYQAEPNLKWYFTIGDMSRPFKTIHNSCLKENYNLFSSEEFAQQTANRQLLDRMLRAFSYENRWEDEYYFNDQNKYIITFNKTLNGFVALETTNIVFDCPAFVSIDLAYSAIDRIVKPFMESHPNFRWGV